ncbi:DUF1761 domain-containing protein [Flavobacterium sp.]|uniref:DUF1761 domain-containing protein n=1 Tax=Flavobacterium sp. TaxID=239 RepID=UPI00260D4B8D|nr:DUF1761 domain-containing protein [Flavobacterium sp.]
MPFNFYAVLVAAFSSFIVGFIWYNPKVFGTIWMNETGMTEEKAQKGNMAKIFGLTFVFSFMLAFMMPVLVIHQMGVFGLVGGNETDPLFVSIMETHGDTFRSFKHGAFHGLLTSLFIALPVIATNCLFEQKTFKYVAITAGYWMVVMTIMGAIICGWK